MLVIVLVSSQAGLHVPFCRQQGEQHGVYMSAVVKIAQQDERAVKQICSENSFCRALNPETRTMMCAMKSLICHERREVVSLNPEKEGKIMLVRRGEVITFRDRFQGRQKGIECLTAGDVIGISRLFGVHSPPLSVNMYVKVSAQFCVFPIERFENMAMERADFAKAVITNVVGRFFFAINQLEHMTLDTSEEKILYTLGMLRSRAGASAGGSASLAVTHKELAILAGVNRITATRVLEHLRKGGVFAPAGKNKPTNAPD